MNAYNSNKKQRARNHAVLQAISQVEKDGREYERRERAKYIQSEGCNDPNCPVHGRMQSHALN